MKINVSLGIYPFLSILLTVIFIILKVCNVITWSWIWIFCPIWILVALVFFIIFYVIFLYFMRDFFE